MDQRTRSEQYRHRRHSSLWDPGILVPAIVDSFRKLDPRWQARNPVMFVVEVGSVITTIAYVAGLFQRGTNELFVGQIAIWLWFTVLFANFAEAVAEGRGKAQAASLRRTRSELTARRLKGWSSEDGLPPVTPQPTKGGMEERVPAPQLRKGDRVVCEA